MAEQVVQRRDVALVAEEVPHRRPHRIPDPVDRREHRVHVAATLGRFHRLVAEGFDGREGPRQERCRGLPDMANAEGEDEAIQLRLATRVDGIEQLVEPFIGAFLGAQHLLAHLARQALALGSLRLAALEQRLPHLCGALAEPEQIGLGLQQPG